MSDRLAQAMMHLPWSKDSYRVVGIAAGFLANDEGQFCVSAKGLADCAHVSERTVQRAKSEARRAGWLVETENSASRIPITHLLIPGFTQLRQTESGGVTALSPLQTARGDSLDTPRGVTAWTPRGDSPGVVLNSRGDSLDAQCAPSSTTTSYIDINASEQSELLPECREWLDRIYQDAKGATKQRINSAQIASLERVFTKWQMKALTERGTEVDIDAEAEKFIAEWNAKLYGKRKSWWKTWWNWLERACALRAVPGSQRGRVRVKTTQDFGPAATAGFADL